MYPFDDYAAKLCGCETYDDAFSTYSNYIKSLGYQHVSYIFIPRMVLDNHLLSSPVFKAKGKRAKNTKAKRENINRFKHYAENETHQRVEEIKNGYIKIIDWKKEARNKRKSPKTVKTVQEQVEHTKKRYEYQLIKGLPIHSLAGDKGIGIALASVMSDDDSGQFFQQLKKETEYAWELGTNIFHSHALSKAYEFNDVTEPLLESLSETEKKVLKALPTGKTSAVIAKELGRSPRYIDNVIRELRMKVGGETADGNPHISTTLLIYYIGLTQLLDRF